MTDFFETSLYFGIILTLFSYQLGLFIYRKWKSPFFHPMLISILFCIIFLAFFQIPYNTYATSTKLLSSLVTPTTICLAIPLYEQFTLLKKYPGAILCGIISGAITSLCIIFLCALFFSIDYQGYASLLSKSITTAIGVDITQQIKGFPSLTVAAIMITGILGNGIAEFIFRVFRIHHPIAKGVALGTSAHALGTVKALEMGKVEGAVSSLSIIIAGIITVPAAIMFSLFFPS